LFPEREIAIFFSLYRYVYVTAPTLSSLPSFSENASQTPAEKSQEVTFLLAAGVTFAIVRKDVLGKVSRYIPTMLDYRTHIDGESMYNTPPVFPIFVMTETLRWVKELGGVEAVYKMNKEKAEILYAEIDRNPLFKGTAAKEDRSLMNVCFVMAEGYENLQDEFFAFAKERGMTGIKGHRSVGGFRASIYNACPKESVEALVACMQEFEQLHK
jgi:phosphoserine aminotransferase